MTDHNNGQQFPWFPGVPLDLVEDVLKRPPRALDELGLDALTRGIVGATVFPLENKAGASKLRDQIAEALGAAVCRHIPDAEAARQVKGLIGGVFGEVDDAANRETICLTDAAAAVGFFLGAMAGRSNPDWRPTFPDLDALQACLEEGVSEYPPIADSLRKGGR